MKYFIDFEATQYTKEIISIGCVREDGETFYSLIRPKDLKTITDFITSLTGIKRQDLVNENQSDEVFEKFFNWLNRDMELAEFFCYGNSDLDFLKKNLEDRTFNFKAQAALSMIAMNLTDYSSVIKDYFGLIKNISLKKVFDYFYPNNNCIWHNALNDAEMLYKIYLKIKSKERIVEIPFPEYIATPIFKNSQDFALYQIKRVDSFGKEEVYGSLEDAIKYILNLLKEQGNNKKVNKKNIEKRLINAINGKNKYFKQKWIVEIKTKK